MLDGERVAGKAANSLKNPSDNATSNSHVFSSSDIDEDDNEGPSTSNYNDSNINELSYYAEDLEITDHKEARQRFAEFRYLLEHDGVFNRIRTEILADLEKMAQEQQNSDNSKLTHRQRFEFLERLDDLLDTANDLNEAHLAVLRHIAVQVSKHAPLEAMGDFDLEHLFVMPEKQKENGIKDDLVSPPKKVRKFRNSDERKLSTATAPRIQQIEETISVKGSFASAKSNSSDIETTKISVKESKESVSTRDSKTNGLASPINGEKNGIKNEIHLEPTPQLVEAEKITNGGRNNSIEMVEIKNEDPPASNKNPSSKTDSDSNSNTDAKETRSGEKPKKSEIKKSFKKPANGKPNGVSKPTKLDKATYRRASERHGSKASRTPEPEPKKTKRRAATTVVAEPTNEVLGRQTVQRRTTRNTQPNSELTNIDEQTYCSCDQISYGQMICCDNNNCRVEWYHFECVGLKVKPGKGQKWFCPSCRDGGKSTVMRSTLRR